MWKNLPQSRWDLYSLFVCNVKSDCFWAAHGKIPDLSGAADSKMNLLSGWGKETQRTSGLVMLSSLVTFRGFVIYHGPVKHAGSLYKAWELFCSTKIPHSELGAIPKLEGNADVERWSLHSHPRSWVLNAEASPFSEKMARGVGAPPWSIHSPVIVLDRGVGKTASNHSCEAFFQLFTHFYLSHPKIRDVPACQSFWKKPGLSFGWSKAFH